MGLFRKKKLILFGTGLFGQLARYYIDHYSTQYVVSVVTESPISPDIFNKMRGVQFCDFDIIQNIYPPHKYDMFVAVGYREMNSIRKEMYYKALDKGYYLPSFSFMHTSLYSNVGLGNNCFIFEDNTIQPFVDIGHNVILWSGNHIGHHSKIGDHNFISSHVVISGNVTVGESCFFGVNSTIIDGINIGDRCLIGARSLITRNAYSDSVYITRGTKPDVRTSAEMNF